MAINVIVSLDTKDFDKKFKALLTEHPNYIRNAGKAVNRAVIKDTKRVMQSRGYMAHKPRSYGDAGYQGKGNIDQDFNRDLSGKIWFSSRSYHLKFVEYGAHVTWKTRRGSFTLPANPILEPVANEYWKGDKGRRIIEEYLQKQYDKVTGGK